MAQADTWPRRMRIGSSFGLVIKDIWWTILAGCSSTSLARCFLLEPVEAAGIDDHEIDVGVHVDNVSQTITLDVDSGTVAAAIGPGTVSPASVGTKGPIISSKSASPTTSP